MSIYTKSGDLTNAGCNDASKINQRFDDINTAVNGTGSYVPRFNSDGDGLTDSSMSEVTAGTIVLAGKLQATGLVSAGNLTINSGSITDSSGAISFGNENLSTSGLITSGNGASATPSINFTGSTTSGFYWNAGSSYIGLSIAGAEYLAFAATYFTSNVDFYLVGKIVFGLNEAELYVSSNDFYLENTTQDKDIVFKVNDGGVAKTITWDASTDKLKHSAGLFNFDNDNLTTTGIITGNSFVTAQNIGIAADDDLLQLAANALTINGSCQATNIGVGTAPSAVRGIDDTYSTTTVAANTAGIYGALLWTPSADNVLYGYGINFRAQVYGTKDIQYLGNIVVTRPKNYSGTILGEMIGFDVYFNPEDSDAMTLAGNGFGLRINCYKTSQPNMPISGDLYGTYLRVDEDDFVVSGTSYCHYWLETGSPDYGLYQNGTAVNRFGGDIQISGDSKYLKLGAGQDSGTTDTGTYMLFDCDLQAATGRYFRFENGSMAIGAFAPTAVLHLKAGTATAGTGPLKFTAGTALTTAETGTMEYHNDRLYFTNVARRHAIDQTCDVITSDTTVANTTTETTVYTSTIPANELKVGNVIKQLTAGVMSTVSAADVVTGRVKIGGTTIATITSAGSGVLTNEPWHFQVLMTIRTVGGAGTQAHHIDLELDGLLDVDATGSIDTTASCDITVTVQWNNAKAGNTLTIHQGITEYKG